ncbi:MAG: hypothetical protein WDA75_19140 [Candidatus Latescibacterota bacterium]|jgi:hypothetical protein
MNQVEKWLALSESESVRRAFGDVTEVDYSLSIAQLVENGHYDKVCEGVTDWWLSVVSSKENGEEGIVRYENKIFSIGNEYWPIPPEHIEQKIEQDCRENPWKAWTVWQTLTYAITFPDNQRICEIIGLGTVKKYQSGFGMIKVYLALSAEAGGRRRILDTICGSGGMNGYFGAARRL